MFFEVAMGGKGAKKAVCSRRVKTFPFPIRMFGMPSPTPLSWRGDQSVYIIRAVSFNGTTYFNPFGYGARENGRVRCQSEGVRVWSPL